MSESPSIGRRIVVWGTTGSGKTTFARHIGATYGLKVVELDAYRHGDGWNSMPWDEFEKALEQDLDDASDGWVSDGSYNPVMHVYLTRADTVVWLHPPWRVSFWRLLQRTVRRAFTQERLYNSHGPNESLRMSFLTRDSILWWSISHHRTAVRNYRARITALPPGVRVYELRSAREVREFLQRLPTTDATHVT